MHRSLASIAALAAIPLLVLSGCATPGLPCPGLNYRLELSPNGQWLAFGSDSLSLKRQERGWVADLSQLGAPEAVRPLELPDETSLHALAFAPDAEIAALVGGDPRQPLAVVQLDGALGRAKGPAIQLPVPEGTVFPPRAGASRDGARWLLVWDHMLSCVQIADGKASALWEQALAKELYAGPAALSLDGSLAAIVITRLAGTDTGVSVHAPTIRVIDLSSGELRFELGPLIRGAGADQAPVIGLQALAFSPNGETLASGEEHGLIRFWSLSAGSELSRLTVLSGGSLQSPGTLGARPGATTMEITGASLTSLSYVDNTTLAVGADNLTTTMLRLTGPGTAEMLWRHDPPGGASGFRTTVVGSQRGGCVARAGRPLDRKEPEHAIRVFRALSGDDLD